MALRICLDCGKEAFTIEDLEKFKKNKSSKHGRENLCNKCHHLRYWTPEHRQKWLEKNPEYHKKWREAHPDYMTKILKKQFIFKEKRMYPKENPRSNICSECGRSHPKDLTRQTHLHHIIYDEKNPLAWTVELCASCHVKLHKRLKQEK